MPNITVSVDDEELIREAKAVASLQGKSLSEVVREHLRNIIHKEKRVDQSRKEALRLMEEGFSLGGKPLNREDTHDRTLGRQ